VRLIGALARRTREDRRLAGGLALLATGLAVLALGLVGLSRHHETVDMMPYMISGAVGGTFCLGLGATLTATASLRANWPSLDRLDQLLDVEGR
jgi:hypothetical protein